MFGFITASVTGLLCSALLGISLVVPAPQTRAQRVVGQPGSPQVHEIIELTNHERSRAGLASLRASSALARAAQLQANQIARARRLDHVLPKEPHPRPEDRLEAADYEWEAWAENLAFGPSPARVVASWMASAGHRANILNPRYTEFGVGIARAAGGRVYYVQVFGRPRFSAR
jgi:uncharacterized protein YkwD